ncbi:AraC family transcriptional regulator [Parashewanella tropica]|uniref:AraC family transcriptional regulator n=1 Tax=Parashewanella tropica TaxID=2547970 RepID=UPI00105A966E|nr:AraC family transcriptional regulator [Parashewanella tropica]
MQFNNLVHEELLIASLSETWKARFEKAIQLMHQDLSKPLYWPDIAKQCASSPTHFHSIFKAVMGEPPASYHRRLRLKQVLLELYFAKEKTITNIALDAGFSTVQSLAKILKKHFGKTAKEIRQEDITENYEILRKKVEHVVDDTSSEQALSQTIDFSISVIDKQFYKLKNSSDYRFQSIIASWDNFAPKDSEIAVTVTPINNDNFEFIYKLGYETTETEANHCIPHQQYLTCHVKVKDTSTYIACWEALYKEAFDKSYEIDEDAEAVEFIHNPRATLSLHSNLTLMLPIKKMA